MTHFTINRVFFPHSVLYHLFFTCPKSTVSNKIDKVLALELVSLFMPYQNVNLYHFSKQAKAVRFLINRDRRILARLLFNVPVTSCGSINTKNVTCIKDLSKANSLS